MKQLDQMLMPTVLTYLYLIQSTCPDMGLAICSLFHAYIYISYISIDVINTIIHISQLHDAHHGHCEMLITAMEVTLHAIM